MRVLAGEGVALEPQVAAHASELFALLTDARLYTYLDDQPPLDEASLRARFVRLEARQSPDGTERWLNWVVRARVPLVGYVQATIFPDYTASIGYVIGANHWRRGYGRAAVSAMLTELAEVYAVRHASATIDRQNEGSRQLLLSLGFAWELELESGEQRYGRELT
ncbi:GNAT family N-acetyltransferase [Devosia sp.]|uniref:GNAT family N-acetyltransferase n=1 Tax=Devosia sp. TaxID=1871048 RepID=UPI003BACADC9